MSTPDETGTPPGGKRPRPRRRSAAVSGEPTPPPEPPSEEPTAETPAPVPRSAVAGLRVAKATGGRRPRQRSEPAATETAMIEPAAPALAGEIGPSGLDGVPASYDDGVEWLRNGLRRHGRATLIALILGWTGIWLALWGAAIGIVAGLLFALQVVSSPFGNVLTHAGAGQAITITSVAVACFLGAIGGFLFVLRWVLFATPWELIVALVSGALIALIVVLVSSAYERLGLRLRGYRRLSRDEVRRIAPLVRDVAEGMDLDGLPRFAMTDSVLPNAWSHMRTIVVTTGLLQTLDDDELRAILAHELRHWRSGDSVGLHIVWAAAWPVALVLNLGMLIAGKRQGQAGAPGHLRGILVLLGWLIACPAWVILKLGITPAVGAAQRRYEYEADAAAAALGYAPSLITALGKMGAFEGGRTGWEDAMAATHPPTELRIEALQPPRPDDAQYQEDELRAPRLDEIRRLFRALRPRYQRR